LHALGDCVLDEFIAIEFLYFGLQQAQQFLEAACVCCDFPREEFDDFAYVEDAVVLYFDVAVPGDELEAQVVDLAVAAEGMFIGDEFLEAEDQVGLVLHDDCLLELGQDEGQQGEGVVLAVDQDVVVDLDYAQQYLR
jgi:hypothetical protein